MNFPGCGGPSSQRQGGEHQRIRNVGSMYQAFEEYERQARQRKYLIAEYEDTSENLQKEFKDVVERNKSMEGECEKLEIAAQASEANYHRAVQEKAVMENKYRGLSKEMDEVTEDIAKKKAQIKQVETFYEAKIEQIKITEEKYLNEYMKDPKITAFMESSKKADELADALRGKRKELVNRKKRLQEFIKRQDEAWETFKKNCIKVAEVHSDLMKTLALRDILKAQYENIFKTPTGIPLRRSQGSQQIGGAQQRTNQFQRSAVVPLSRALGRIDGRGSEYGFAIPRQPRSPTFQQLDRMLWKSNNAVSSVMGDRRGSMAAKSDSGNKSWRNLCSPMKSGSSLVSQIRSKLKDTVTVRPMPRNQNVQMEHSIPSHITNRPTVNSTLSTDEILADSPPPSSQEPLNPPLQENGNPIPNHSEFFTSSASQNPSHGAYGSEQMQVNDDCVMLDAKTDQAIVDQNTTKGAEMACPSKPIAGLDNSKQTNSQTQVPSQQNDARPTLGSFVPSSQSVVGPGSGLNFFGNGDSTQSSIGDCGSGDTGFFDNLFSTPFGAAAKAPEFSFLF